jgi:sugar lactone lactonase YvrE
MHALKVMTVDLSGKSETIAEVPGQPAGLGWLPDGHLLIVSQTDRRLWRIDAGGLSEVADLSKLADVSCNDMVVDRKGRAYIGHFGSEMSSRPSSFSPADIIMVEPEGSVRVVADNLVFPNGMAITTDGQTLIVAETFGHQLTAFDIKPDGSLAGRRVWAALGEATADGLCLDAEGAVWVATCTNQVIRVQQGGKVSQRIKVSTRAFSCMLGGPDRHTLFVTTAESFDPVETRAKRSGCIETIRVDVPGAGLP